MRIDQDVVEEAVEMLERELRRTSRDPFKRALQRLLGFRPTAEALQAFANKSPDKWAAAVNALASLAGYEKGINVTLRMKPVEQMSDAELLAEYRQNQARVAALAQGLVTGEVVDAVVLPPLPAQVEEKK